MNNKEKKAFRHQYRNAENYKSDFDQSEELPKLISKDIPFRKSLKICIKQLEMALIYGRPTHYSIENLKLVSISLDKVIFAYSSLCCYNEKYEYPREKC